MIELWDSKNVTPAQIRARGSKKSEAAEMAVAGILEDIRKKGDYALLEYTCRFDGVALKSLMVTAEEISEALSSADSALISTMYRCAENIRDFHKRQVHQGFLVTERYGMLLGQRILPLDRVGIYVPGGTAAYPSTVLMNAIPAKIAGVREIILATPPNRDGNIPALILAAAHVAGVDRIYKMGGAQAIAAMAYGTQTVPQVDKITGPGNIYVATAKRQVYGTVDIDMIAGPSEILIIADDSANAHSVAADLLGQAEHDAMAASILLTTSKTLAQHVQAELETQLALLPRYEIASKSIQDNGRIVITSSLSEAAEICNAIAPEHLELCVDDPLALMGEIRHAGSIFLGHYTPEALGDYYAGPNHTLPTNGAARFSSPLSVDDFVKKSSFLSYSKNALANARGDIELFAHAEGFVAHARSIRARFEEGTIVE